GRVVAASASDLFRLELDGSVTPLAGNGDADEASPDGTVALGAPVGGVLGLLPLPDGSLLFGERESRSVRRITPYGTLATVAGSGDVGALELGVASRQTPFERPIALALTPARTVAVAEAFSGRVVELRAALPPWQTEGYEIPSTDGAVVHRFDSGGHHLETVHGITRAPLHTFAYDADGLLTSVTDGDGLVTTIERGTETAIVSPYGERTVLDVSDDGWLEGLTNPAGEVRAFAYTEGGLLTAATDARGHTKSYEWSPFGRLTRTGDAGDGFQSFTRSNRTLAGEPNFVVRRETATGGATAYRHHTWSTGEEMRRTTHADGTRSWTVTVPSTGTRERAHSSGMRTVQRETPSPLHGLAVGVPSRTSIVRPSGMRSSMSLSIDAELGTPGDASSLEALTTTWTIDGRSGSSRFDAASRTKTETSPLGRLRSTQYDALGRMTRHERPRTETIEAHYTPSGRLAQLRTGDGAPGSDDAPRVQTLHYDAFDRLERVEDPIGRVTSYSYDAARRLESVVLPGADPGGDPGATIGLGWDASSNLASFTPPGRPAYTFGYTPRDQLERVTLPDVGDGASSATFRYDAGRRLTGFARSDGRGLALDYNARQQLIRATETRVDDATGEPEPVRARGFTYDAESGHLSRVEDTTSGESLAFTYDGSVPASVEWSGTVAGRIEATVDASFRIAALEVTVGTETDVITYAYDDDSLLTRAGALAIAREADTGRIASASVGTIETAVSYTPFGELAAQTVTVDGAPLVAETYGYDARGWLVERAATRAGVTTTTTYSYDPRGRLEAVEVDGAPVAVYGYDANSNRIAAADAFGTVTPADVELDARDRLLAVGGVTYTYTDAGDLVARAAGAAVDTFTYDVAGNLRHVELADGRVIDYAIDPSHRRIGKSIDGVLVEGYLYQDRLNPIVQLDGSGAPVARFVYGTRPHVPDLMLRGGVIYRYVHDVRGSPRFVLDTRDGSIVQELQFDAFGRVVLDTNPGFQPFGFAGGLYDRDTGLVRLGARDYDPTLGRWTTPDPAGFGGGPNLYAYAGGNPVNFIDPNGAEPVTVAAAAWAVAEVGLTAWDVWEMGRTFSDPCATTTEKAIVAGGFAVGVVLPLGGYGAAGKKLLKQGVTNEVPDRLARAIPGDVNFPTLGRLDAEDVFVTSADDIAGMNADEIAERLTVPHSPEFTVFEFPTPEAGLATPINRPDPGFIGGGRTAGGAREYVLPNGPIPSGATRRVVR
ncbi:MAG: polymorphic toxin type 10 domain-containing protein, partial [Acidobacteriota bacterium]